SSSFRYTLTNRRSLPPSTSFAPRPGWRLSRSSMSSPRVEPDPSTALAPSVRLRMMVGMRTSVAMGSLSSSVWGLPPVDNGARTPVIPPRVSTRGSVRVDDLDRLLGDLPVEDAEGPELDGVRARLRVAGGDQHVVRVGLGGVGDVGARGVEIGRAHV